MKLEDLERKKILILGFGREGQASFKFLKKYLFKKKIGIADKYVIRAPDKNTTVYTGKNYLKSIKYYDVIIRSPGIAPKIVEPLLNKRQKLTSLTEIFLENCQSQIIGITGTQGKGTVSSLVYWILKKSGFKVRLVGNIGKPALEFIDQDNKRIVYIYEMSSHQLYGIKKSPHIAVFLNISQAHLDYFRSFNEYIDAKGNITRYQTADDFLIYNPRDEIVNEIAERSRAKKIAFPEDPKKFFSGFCFRIPMIGRFNAENVSAAVCVARIFKIPAEKIVMALEVFSPLPHRLEFIGTYRGIRFYDDSASVVPKSTVSAINTLGKDLKTVILGGYESKVSFKSLIKAVAGSDVINLIFFLPSGKRIWEEMQKNRVNKNRKINVFFPKDMKTAVKLSYEFTPKRKICLLSPGVPSFGVFKNYIERGVLFKKYIKLYGKQ